MRSAVVAPHVGAELTGYDGAQLNTDTRFGDAPTRRAMGGNVMRVATFVTLGCVCLGSLYAEAAPAELLNKTVSVSYTVTIPGRASDGTTTVGSRNATRTFYISSAGRVFGRVTRSDGRFAETRDAAPGDPAHNLHFDGNKLIGVMPFVRGAAQMMISFSPGGQTCDANIVIGREGGRTLSWKGVNGKTYEATGTASVSNVSCSIRPGNAFTGE